MMIPLKSKRSQKSEQQLSTRSLYTRILAITFIVGATFSSMLGFASQLYLRQTTAGIQIKDTTQSPRICSSSSDEGKVTPPPPLTWVMFMGDSNMRHTYYWWTNEKTINITSAQKGSTYGKDRVDLSFGGRWADQEWLGRKIDTDTKTNTNTNTSRINNDDSTLMVRYSFRFLHGSINELVNSAKNWDIARRAAPEPNAATVEKEVADELQQRGVGGGQEKGENSSSSSSSSKSGNKDDDDDDKLWEGKIRPNDFAIWANKHQTPIDDNPSDFNSWKSEWKKKSSPDIVILTQGWGGVPSADDVEIVRQVVRNNPETLFIWSPMYVTDRKRERYYSYVNSGVFSWTEQNLRMVDLWSMVKNKLRKQENEHSLLHIPIGGEYMKAAMKRIWEEAVEACRSSHN